MIIRNSEAQDFLRCRLKWDYRWNRKLEPKRKSMKLVIGTLFHKFLENYYTPTILRTEEQLQFSIKAMHEMYEQDIVAKIETGAYDAVEAGEMWDFLEKLAKWYHEYWSQKQEKPWEVIATEKTYYINMTTLEVREEATEEMETDLETIWYECTLDLVVRVDGKLWLVDHKTTNNLDYFIKNAEMDRQISRYIFALNAVYPEEEIGGLIYNLIKKELPHEPAVLKKGGLSKAKDQRTTYTLYLNKLIELGLATIDLNDEGGKIATDAAHMEVLQSLAAREHKLGNDYLYRLPVKRNDAELNNAMNELLQVAHAIRQIRKFMAKYPGIKDYRHPIYRNITKDCSWDCPVKDICKAGMDGSDVTYLENELLEPITKEGLEG